jgi:hypothetical protein
LEESTGLSAKAAPLPPSRCLRCHGQPTRRSATAGLRPGLSRVAPSKHADHQAALRETRWVKRRLHPSIALTVSMEAGGAAGSVNKAHGVADAPNGLWRIHSEPQPLEEGAPFLPPIVREELQLQGPRLRSCLVCSCRKSAATIFLPSDSVRRRHRRLRRLRTSYRLGGGPSRLSRRRGVATAAAATTHDLFPYRLGD